MTMSPLPSLFPFFLRYLCSGNFPFWDRGTVTRKTTHSRQVQGSTGSYHGASPLHPGAVRKTETGRIRVSSVARPGLGRVGRTIGVCLVMSIDAHTCLCLWVHIPGGVPVVVEVCVSLRVYSQGRTWVPVCCICCWPQAQPDQVGEVPGDQQRGWDTLGRMKSLLPSLGSYGCCSARANQP